MLWFLLLLAPLLATVWLDQAGISLFRATIDAPRAFSSVFGQWQKVAAPSLESALLPLSVSTITSTEKFFFTRILEPTLGTMPTRYFTATMTAEPTSAFSSVATPSPLAAETKGLDTLVFAGLLLLLSLLFLAAVYLWCSREQRDLDPGTPGPAQRAQDELDLLDSMAAVCDTLSKLNDQRSDDIKLIEDLRKQLRVKNVSRMSQRPEREGPVRPTETPVFDGQAQSHPFLAGIGRMIDGTATQTSEPLAAPAPATGDDGASEAPAATETKADDLVGNGETKKPTAGTAGTDDRGPTPAAGDSHETHATENEDGNPFGEGDNATAADGEDNKEQEAADEAPTTDAGDSHPPRATEAVDGNTAGVEGGATVARVEDAEENGAAGGDVNVAGDVERHEAAEAPVPAPVRAPRAEDNPDLVAGIRDVHNANVMDIARDAAAEENAVAALLATYAGNTTQTQVPGQINAQAPRPIRRGRPAPKAFVDKKPAPKRS